MAKGPQWEFWVNSCSEQPPSCEAIRRAEVFGGWLVQATTDGKTANGKLFFAESMAFVPDPNHEWKIEVDTEGYDEAMEKIERLQRVYN